MDNYRQGDVPLIPYLGSLEGFEQVPPEGGKLVLELGVATGHHHRVEGCGVSDDAIADRARLYRDPASGATVLEVCAIDVELVHEEHDPIPLEPGRYLRLVQVEDDGEMISQVID